MHARRSVWGNAKVQELAGQFLPAADEVWELQNAKGPAGEMFRAVAAKGHYGGRGDAGSKQGIYAIAPSGELLASVNSTGSRDVIDMLTKALEAWEKLPAEKRKPAAALPDDPGRWDALYPEGGLVLRIVSRDLPRGGTILSKSNWNQDFAWFTRAELATMMPRRLGKETTIDFPAELARRLARCHFVDNVRGETLPYADRDIRTAVFTATLHEQDGDAWTLDLAGEFELVKKGKWHVDESGPTAQERGFRGKAMGSATWNAKDRRFTMFELVVAGTRWGGTRYNYRSDDLSEAPIGYVVRLSGDSPAERIAPASIWDYGWGDGEDGK